MKQELFWTVNIFSVAAMLTLGSSRVAGATVDLYDFEGNYNDTSGFGAPLNMTPTATGTAPTFANEVAPRVATNFFGNTSLRINSSNSFTWVTPLANTKLELQKFTVQAWIKPSTNNETGTIFSYVPRQAGADGRGYIFNLSGGKLQFQYGRSIDNTFDVTTANTVLQSGVWYHVAVAFEWPCCGSNTNAVGEKFFINGAVDYFATPTYNPDARMDYSDGGASFGPNPKAAFIGGFHNANNTVPDAQQDMIIMLANGTLLDRVKIDDQAYGSYSIGSQAAPLD